MCMFSFVSCFHFIRALNVILVFNTEGQRFLRVGLAVPLFGSISTLRAMVAEEGKLSPDQVRTDVCHLILSLSPSLCRIFLFLNLIVCNTHSLLYCIVMHTHTLHSLAKEEIFLHTSSRLTDSNSEQMHYSYSIKLPLNTLHLLVNGNFPDLLSQGSRCYCAARYTFLMPLL